MCEMGWMTRPPSDRYGEGSFLVNHTICIVHSVYVVRWRSYRHDGPQRHQQVDNQLVIYCFERFMDKRGSKGNG